VAGAFLFDADGMMVTAIPETYMAEAVAGRLAKIPGPLVPGRSFSELSSRGHTALIAGMQLPGEDDAVQAVFVSVPVEGMVNVASGYLTALVPVSRLDQMIKLAVGEGAALLPLEQQPAVHGEVTGGGSGSSASVLLATARVPFELNTNLTASFSERRESLLRPVGETARRLSLYAAVLIALVAAFAVYLTRRLLLPLRMLEDQAAGYGRGDYDAPRPVFRYRELEDFSRSLADMAIKVRDRQELQQSVFRAELDLLRNQMNPHFLFNTLNAISTYMTIDQAKATGMSERLASLYRMILQATRKSTVPLADELDIVRAYLDLESVRFGKRLTWDISCIPAAEDFQVPGLILQTLVENAIKHGVSKAMDGGRVEVRITAEDPDACLIAVINSGEPYRKSENGGIGIENTRRRLDILFGPQHRFTIGSQPDGKTAVTFRVPRQRG
jgi:signal transduction histidine kinase